MPNHFFSLLPDGNTDSPVYRADESVLLSLYHNRKVQRVQRGRIAIGAASRQGSEGSEGSEGSKGSEGCGIALRAMSFRIPLRGMENLHNLASSVGRFIGRSFCVQAKDKLRPTWRPSAGSPQQKCTPIPLRGLLLKGSMSLDFRSATLPYKSSSFATPEGEVCSPLPLVLTYVTYCIAPLESPPPGETPPQAAEGVHFPRPKGGCPVLYKLVPLLFKGRLPPPFEPCEPFAPSEPSR